MKSPVDVKVTYNHARGEILARFSGADGDSAELIVPDGQTLYQGLQGAQGTLAALISAWVPAAPVEVIPAGEPFPEPPEVAENLPLRPMAPQGTGFMASPPDAQVDPGVPTEPAP